MRLYWLHIIFGLLLAASNPCAAQDSRYHMDYEGDRHALEVERQTRSPVIKRYRDNDGWYWYETQNGNIKYFNPNEGRIRESDRGKLRQYHCRLNKEFSELILDIKTCYKKSEYIMLFNLVKKDLGLDNSNPDSMPTIRYTDQAQEKIGRHLGAVATVDIDEFIASLTYLFEYLDHKTIEGIINDNALQLEKEKLLLIQMLWLSYQGKSIDDIPPKYLPSLYYSFSWIYKSSLKANEKGRKMVEAFIDAVLKEKWEGIRLSDILEKDRISFFEHSITSTFSRSVNPEVFFRYLPHDAWSDFIDEPDTFSKHLNLIYKLHKFSEKAPDSAQAKFHKEIHSRIQDLLEWAGYSGLSEEDISQLANTFVDPYTIENHKILLRLLPQDIFDKYLKLYYEQEPQKTTSLCATHASLIYEEKYGVLPPTHQHSPTKFLDLLDSFIHSMKDTPEEILAWKARDDFYEKHAVKFADKEALKAWIALKNLDWNEEDVNKIHQQFVTLKESGRNRSDSLPSKWWDTAKDLHRVFSKVKMVDDFLHSDILILSKKHRTALEYASYITDADVSELQNLIKRGLKEYREESRRELESRPEYAKAKLVADLFSFDIEHALGLVKYMKEDEPSKNSLYLNYMLEYRSINELIVCLEKIKHQNEVNLSKKFKRIEKLEMETIVTPEMRKQIILEPDPLDEFRSALTSAITIAIGVLTNNQEYKKEFLATKSKWIDSKKLIESLERVKFKRNKFQAELNKMFSVTLDSGKKVIDIRYREKWRGYFEDDMYAVFPETWRSVYGNVTGGSDKVTDRLAGLLDNHQWDEAVQLVATSAYYDKQHDGFYYPYRAKGNFNIDVADGWADDDTLLFGKTYDDILSKLKEFHRSYHYSHEYDTNIKGFNAFILGPERSSF